MRLLFLVSFIPCILLAQSNRLIAIQQIADLKNGALVVRLKTNDKSVEAYRRNGRNDIADRIIADRKIQNQKIVDAFRNNFDFCKVYFIHAVSTNRLLEGATDIFLNDAMELDTSIRLKETYFLLAEYGTVTANMRSDEYHYKNVGKTEPSSTATTSSAIFISDTTLTQLKEPFPFYQVVILENYNKAVSRLNNALHRFYFNRVSNTIPTDKPKN